MFFILSKFGESFFRQESFSIFFYKTEFSVMIGI